MTKITILNPVQPSETFVLRKEGLLERLAEDAEAPEGHIAVFNPAITSQYVEIPGGLKPVDEVPEGQKPYEFKGDISVYMRL